MTGHLPTMVLGVVLMMSSQPVRADDAAAKAPAALETACFKCHGQGGVNMGGVGDILNTESLIEKGLIVPGKAEESRLIIRIRKGEMPLGGPRIETTSETYGALVKWINGLKKKEDVKAPVAAPQVSKDVVAPTGGQCKTPKAATLDKDCLTLADSMSKMKIEPTNISVTQHHGDQKRTAHYVEPNFTRESVKGITQDMSFNPTLDGPVYAQPLYVKRKSPSGKDLMIVATEKNQLSAIDTETGKTVWNKSLGQFVKLDDLPCGNIDPLGVTGTPAIDQATRTVYTDAMTTPDGGKTKKHMIWAHSIDDGSVRPGYPIDVSAKASADGVKFLSENQNQRGALMIVGGKLYVPYGGHYGDCGDFHGWVVSVDLSNPSQVKAFKTGAQEGGIWAPGGMTTDGSSLYVSTGNTDMPKTWEGGDAIIRIKPDMKLSKNKKDFFAPTDWKQLDEEDLDMADVAPILVDVPGATPSKLVVALGKNGKAYVLDRDNLGGVHDGLSSKVVSEGPIIGAPAVYKTPKGTYVVFKGRGAGCPAGQKGDLTALKISATKPPQVSVAWCAKQNGTGSPIVTTKDGTNESIVWGLGAEGDNKLHAINADTGEPIAEAEAKSGADETEIQRFSTPLVVKGSIYFAVNGKLCRFVLP